MAPLQTVGKGIAVAGAAIGLGPIGAAVVVAAATLVGVGFLISYAVNKNKEQKMTNVLNKGNINDKDNQFIKNNSKLANKILSTMEPKKAKKNSIYDGP